MTGDINLVDSIPPNIEFSGRIPAPVQEKELYYFDNIAYVPKVSACMYALRTITFAVPPSFTLYMHIEIFLFGRLVISRDGRVL